jgi:hypothetical protein
LGWFQPHPAGVDPVEQPHAGSKQDGRQVDLQLLEQSGVEGLLYHVRASSDLHIFVTGSGPGLLDGAFYSVGTKVNVVPWRTQGSRARW